MWFHALLLVFFQHLLVIAAAFSSNNICQGFLSPAFLSKRQPELKSHNTIMLRRCLWCFGGGGPGQAMNHQAHALRLGLSGQTMSLSQHLKDRTLATSPSAGVFVFKEALGAILKSHFVPVSRIDVDAERFLTRCNFREFVLSRFDIGTLEAQGEESMVRRIVHAHLVGSEADDYMYRQLLVTLSSLPDPWAAPSEKSMFHPDMARITTSSQRNSHLVAGT